MAVHKVYILFGGNLGDVALTFEQIVLSMKRSGIQVIQQSRIYRSAPWGFEAKNDFLNRCVAVETSLSPSKLLEYLKNLESEAGRKPQFAPGYASRCLDLDILFYDDIILNLENLEIPHPRLHLRRFTLVPLAEIAPDFVHPVLCKNVIDLLRDCIDESEVIPL